MVTDSTTKASIPMTASNSKDFAKKKRANRSAKLKKCKLDARREQWLSQVKNKGAVGDSLVYPPRSGSDSSMENLEVKSRGEKDEGGSMYHCSDSDSASNSPTSHISSVLGSSNMSGMIFTGSGSISGGSCSESITGEDEDDNEYLDDWEAVADALAMADVKQEEDNHNLDRQSVIASISPPELKPNERVKGNMQSDPPNCRAWKPDDAFRPQTLPNLSNLSKQLSFPMNSGRKYGCEWECNYHVSLPSTCPICCEDLDCTDSRFLPCYCGFRLCLFCHKRILEDDGRCPGCRKQYDYEPIKGEATIDGGSLIFKLARYSSMITPH